jgi:glutamate-1-semialdehyde 2,1-aminomutase
MHAIRAARAYTGNDVVAKFEGTYHGTHDDAQVSVHPPGHLAGPAERPNSVPDSAGVLLAPVMGSAVVPADESFVANLADWTDEHDVPLIVDEVIAFRLEHGGAHAAYGVEPDLVAFGQLIGDGFPVGAFGGRQDLLARHDPRGGANVVHSGTFNANPVTAAAGLAALERFDPDAVERLNDLGDRLARETRACAADRGIDLQVNRAGSLFNVYLSAEPVESYRDEPGGVDELRQQLFLELMEEGVRLAPKLMGALSTPMGEREVETFVTAFGTALARLRPEFEARAPHLVNR